jgi:hypothetical protein
MSSNVKKGASLLQEANTKIKILYDISHKLSLVLEKELRMIKNGQPIRSN